MKHRKFRLSDTELRAIEARERETADALELRRLQGVRLYGSGRDMSLVQQVTGAARRTVGDWLSAYQSKGLVGLKRGWKGGNSRKLSQTKRDAIGQQLNQQTPEQVLGAAYRGVAFWSIETVAEAVEQWYGMRYHSREAYRQLLREAGFSFQQTEGIYRSRPHAAVIAEFEAQAEKK